MPAQQAPVEEWEDDGPDPGLAMMLVLMLAAMLAVVVVTAIALLCLVALVLLICGIVLAAIAGVLALVGTLGAVTASVTVAVARRSVADGFTTLAAISTAAVGAAGGAGLLVAVRFSIAAAQAATSAPVTTPADGLAALSAAWARVPVGATLVVGGLGGALGGALVGWFLGRAAVRLSRWVARLAAARLGNRPQVR